MDNKKILNQLGERFNDVFTLLLNEAGRGGVEMSWEEVPLGYRNILMATLQSLEDEGYITINGGKIEI